MSKESYDEQVERLNERLASLDRRLAEKKEELDKALA
jgi:hypothetical protein